MTSITAFTWNLNRSEAAVTLAVDYLSALGGAFVAAFQEAPDSLAAALPSGAGAPKLIAPHASSVPATGIAIVASPNVARDPTAPVFSSERLEAVHLLIAGKRCAIAAVHGPDLVNNSTERDRAEWGLFASDTLHAFWHDGPLIVLGDFNANPWTSEMTSRRGFLASREADWREHHRESYRMPYSGVKRRPLLNPMWPLVVQSGWSAASYKGRHEDVSWHLIDQIVISSDLAPSNPPPRPSVLTQLETASQVVRLVDDQERLSPGWSDHLPVRLDLHLPQAS